MAAMMGAMLSRASEQEMVIREMMAIFKLLKDSGGILSLDAAGELLSMSRDELVERIVDRSILGLVVNLDVYIPAFQFIDAFHIHGFHDVWDALHENCSPIDICRFFVQETVGEGGPFVYKVLQQRVSSGQMSLVISQAMQFRQD